MTSNNIDVEETGAWPALVVAIDGPAGSGKSSVSKVVAGRLGFAYLDTGAAYRALAWHALRSGTDLSDDAAIIQTLDSFELTLETDPASFGVHVGGLDVTRSIREPGVSSIVSRIARVAQVRVQLNEMFRAVAASVSEPGIVIEGRDITTVVAPDAPVRILLTASEEVRIARRRGELSGKAAEKAGEALSARDAADRQVVDFMAAAPGVETIDSTELDFPQTVTAIVELIHHRGQRWGGEAGLDGFGAGGEVGSDADVDYRAGAGAGTGTGTDYRAGADGGGRIDVVGDVNADIGAFDDTDADITGIGDPDGAGAGDAMVDPDADVLASRTRALRSALDDFELEGDDLELLEGFADSPDAITYLPALPVVAIVGRPNVGKSALVNRILGRREAVVEDTPGVTRDRVSYRAEWLGRRFTVVDTGGWEPDARGIDASVAAQAEIAARLSDAVLLVVDVGVGATATDEAVVKMLRASGRPVYVVANKADDPNRDWQASELWSLGLGEPYPVSALHGRGVADLLDVVVGALPEVSAVARQEIGGPRRVAIVGRPNVGKSSLLNRAAGEERVVVNELAGTTRDPVDEQIELGGKVWRFVDTAGIRRRVHLQQGADFYASLRTSAAVEKAEVAVVVLDVSEPISEQDVRIIDLVLESGRALVLAFNKWDLLDDDRRRYLEREIEQDLAHVDWAPRVNMSAKTGRHLEKLVPALERALESWDMRIGTGKFNAFLSELVAAHPHPLRGGKQPRILFGTQAATRPPTFVLFTTGFLDAGYRRFIQRRLRELYNFEGTPIVLNMRVRERRSR